MAITEPWPAERLLRIREVAAILHVSETTVRRLIAEKRLPVIQYTPNGKLLVRADDVASLLRSRGGP